ncbi:MAG: cell division protein ZipA C-terminal FtsZ-binding domain-containing protein [Legionellaceae bacterium]|nr:cell division protein ZipA C-terminal FtsZ-binding domain-containing protein [Legionellaceae bacterium]
MQGNWSFILNIVLLVGVIIAIARVLRTRKKVAQAFVRSPSLGQVDTATSSDDIIAVRKLNEEPYVVPTAKMEEDTDPAPFISAVLKSESPVVEQAYRHLDSRHPEPSEEPLDASEMSLEEKQRDVYSEDEQSSPPVMMFLLAKANRQLAGYELLQAVLAAGLRFGEGNLFHRHQYSNGQGTVMCSLAAATDKGVFDLQNIGAFTVRGLCLYMHASGSPGIDEERFDIMLDTAKTLSEDLDTHLLDDRRQPLSDVSIRRYHQQLNLIEEVV